MKTIILLTLILTASISKAADTTYVNAPEITYMMRDYIDITYFYETTRELALARRDRPDIYQDIRTWTNTDEGHAHSLTDVNWPAKCESFLKMFPQHNSIRNLACKMVNESVIHEIILFTFTANATIVLVDGQFDGVIFFDRNINEPSRWHKTLKDPKFKRVYETGGDDDGLSWFYKIQRAIESH